MLSTTVGDGEGSEGVTEGKGFDTDDMYIG